MLRESDIKKAQKTSRGIVENDRGEDQPADKKAALTTGKPLNPKPANPESAPKAGERAQKDAAETTPMNPGEPAGGE